MRLMNDLNEVHTAFDEGVVKLHSRIRYRNPDYQRETRNGDMERLVINTIIGRVFFNQIWPDEIGFVEQKGHQKSFGAND